MASFAAVADLVTYLNHTFAAGAETERAQQALDLASSDIKNYTQQMIEEMEDDTITLDGPDSCELVLPEIPVTVIASVEIDGEALAADDYELSGAAGILRRVNGATWGTKFGSIEVTYTHGYAAIPTDVKSVCLALAARKLTNPAALTSEDVGAADRYGNPGDFNLTGPAELTDDEKRRLDDFAGGDDLG
jgi:hypothetical protein